VLVEDLAPLHEGYEVLLGPDTILFPQPVQFLGDSSGSGIPGAAKGS
jgi:hypothetical protein